MGDRSEFLVIVVIDLLYVIPGVILPTEKKTSLKALPSAVDPLHDILIPLVKTPFVQFFSFKRVNYAVGHS